MADRLPFNTMVDPSLVFSRPETDSPFESIRSICQDAGVELFVPAAAWQVFKFGESWDENPFLRFYVSSPEACNSLGDIDRFLSELGATRFSIKDAREDYSELLAIVSERSPSYDGDIPTPLATTLIEEWAFLEEKSFIIARIKRAFEKFNESGAAYLQIGARGYKNLLAGGADRFDWAVKKTLKRTLNETLSRVDRFRAVAKWIAVGGGSCGALFIPPVAVVTGMGAGFFLLIDPE